jgi:hypothetical protein
MSKSKHNWITLPGPVESALLDNAAFIAKSRLSKNAYLWIIGNQARLRVKKKRVSFWEKPNPSDFDEIDFLVHLDKVDLIEGAEGIRRNAKKLSGRAIYPRDYLSRTYKVIEAENQAD